MKDWKLIAEKQAEIMEIILIYFDWDNFTPDFSIRSKYNILKSELSALESQEVEGVGNNIDWDTLRNNYFSDCISNRGFLKTPSFDIAPHDLFEWFKEKINKKINAQQSSKATDEMINKVYDKIRDDLHSVTLAGFETEDGDRFPLIDLLSSGKTIQSGINEIEEIVEQIEIEGLLRQYTQQSSKVTDESDNHKYCIDTQQQE